MLLRHKPKYQYSGLTIVLSNPSRFDSTELISAIAGTNFNQECLMPETTRYHCDIRLRQDHSDLLPNTKAILLLGETALKEWTKSPHSLNEVRGTPIKINDMYHIASYLPQDANDIIDHEHRLNKLLQEEIVEEEFKSEEDDNKKHGKTQRANYRFWLKQDTKRALQIVANNGALPKTYLDPIYHIAPNSEEIIYTLRNEKNKSLYIDIEIDSDFHITCFSYSFGIPDIYVIPLLDHNYEPFYYCIPEILQSLAIAFRDNEIIAHNGAQFDFLIFPWKYHIPISRKLYDTMIAQHRCFVDVEKSLGHCVSIWTWEPYHKDEADFSYKTLTQCQQLWQYCGKDVYTMILVREAIDTYAKTKPGLEASIKQANESIYPYIIMMLTGIQYNKRQLDSIMLENDKLMTQYMRIIQMLTGPDIDPLISNQKCVKYFHNALGYDIVTRSKKTKAPSLDEKALLRLGLKYNNPIIPILLTYRKRKKESGSLKFTPWIE